MTELLLGRGHEVTLVHRGQTGGALFPAARHVLLDRTVDQSVLREELCDVVLDVSGQTGPMLRETLGLMRGRTPRYVFISTISVYADMAQPGMDEQAPVAVAARDVTDQSDGELYGARKVACEEAVRAAFPHALIVRPGLIAGPHDYTDRLTYWVRRLAAGGFAAAPARQNQPLQLIDVRDLAEWVVRGIEMDLGGTFNLVGPVTTLGAMLAACQTAATTLELLPEAFLLAQGVFPLQDLPLWIAADMRYDGVFQIDRTQALANGLDCRPLEETIAAVRAWDATRDAQPLRIGLSAEREAALLAAWHAQKG